MRRLQFIFIAFLTSLLVINTTFLRKTIAVLLCGVLSFNSASCYGFLNQGEIVNATTPPAKQIDLTGTWTIKRPWTRVNSEGCTAQNPPGVSGDYTGEFKVIQEGKQFQFAPEMAGNGVTLKGSVDERKINFVYTTSTGGVHEAVGTISADGNTVTSEALCSSSRGPATVKEKFIWTRKSCPQFQAMLKEAQKINELANTLARDDKAYLNAVIDIIIKGYNSRYAVYMLDVPSEEIPEYFKDEQQIQAVRSQIIARMRTKASNRERFANIGISGKYIPATPVYSKENIELFCTVDSSKFTGDFLDSLWMAGYVDYDLYTQVENQLIISKSRPIPEVLIGIGLTIFPAERIILPFAAKVLGKVVSLTRRGVETFKGLLAKKFPAVITEELISLPPLLDKAEIFAGMEINPAKNAIFRGGNSFKLKPNEARIDKSTGLVKPGWGLSLNADPLEEIIVNKGGAYQIESIPDGLKIIQQGGKLKHFVISPKELMPEEEFQNLLNQVKVFQ